MQPSECEHEHWFGVAERLGIDRLLVVCPDGACDRHLERRTDDRRSVTIWATSCDPVDQQPAPFPVACLSPSLSGAAPELRRAAIHQGVQHLEPGGLLALHPAIANVFADTCVELGLESATPPPESDADWHAVLFRRTQRTTVHDLLWAARATIRRVKPRELFVELAGRRSPIVIDTRTDTDRARAGVIAGSIHVPRTVLEWHLDPANGYRHPAVSGPEDRLVLVCNGGYSSSLAASNLVQMGFADVRDLVGGMRAWLLAGLPVVEADHAHLDL